MKKCWPDLKKATCHPPPRRPPPTTTLVASCFRALSCETTTQPKPNPIQPNPSKPKRPVANPTNPANPTFSVTPNHIPTAKAQIKTKFHSFYKRTVLFSHFLRCIIPAERVVLFLKSFVAFTCGLCLFWERIQKNKFCLRARFVFVLFCFFGCVLVFKKIGCEHPLLLLCFSFFFLAF